MSGIVQVSGCLPWLGHPHVPAGVRKASRHEIAGSGHGGGSNSSAGYGDCMRAPTETSAQIAGVNDSLALFGGILTSEQ